MKKKRAPYPKILSGLNTALKLKNMSGGARTDQERQLERYRQRL